LHRAFMIQLYTNTPITGVKKTVVQDAFYYTKTYKHRYKM